MKRLALRSLFTALVLGSAPITAPTLSASRSSSLRSWVVRRRKGSTRTSTRGPFGRRSQPPATMPSMRRIGTRPVPPAARSS